MIYGRFFEKLIRVKELAWRRKTEYNIVKPSHSLLNYQPFDPGPIRQKQKEDWQVII